MMTIPESDGDAPLEALEFHATMKTIYIGCTFKIPKDHTRDVYTRD